jgi:hypothetical protein
MGSNVGDPQSAKSHSSHNPILPLSSGEKGKSMTGSDDNKSLLSSTQPADWSSSGGTNGMSFFDSSSGDASPPEHIYSAPVVAMREEQAVTRSKFFVFLVLLLAVGGAGTATNLLMVDEEQKDFEATVSFQEKARSFPDSSNVTDADMALLQCSSLQVLHPRFRLWQDRKLTRSSTLWIPIRYSYLLKLQRMQALVGHLLLFPTSP